ncbi:MAG: methyltransferase domain-containing protein [Phycisphaerae bacterium]|nr:methyltransferase domain-containing protein [Phycisphaerae bacterium]
MLTRPGLATIEQWRATACSELLGKLRAFSAEFSSLHGRRLGSSATYFRYDPLDHGMRRWEYPFLIERLTALEGDRPVRLLDAGSGMTCIPFFAARMNPSFAVEACDADPNLPAVFDRINQFCQMPKVAFTSADLRRLPYEDQRFDAVFCMSVLEHTADYPEIVREFRRVLRPGGRCIVTFDISPDGRTDIEPTRAEGLLRALSDNFRGVPVGELLPLAEKLQAPGLLTTEFLQREFPKLLPWHMTWRMFLGAIRRSRMPRTPFYQIAVCGLELTAT